LPRLQARITELGGEYVPCFSRQASFLVVKSLDHISDKAKAAEKWEISVVNESWLNGLMT
jgi:hypothetical protein